MTERDFVTIERITQSGSGDASSRMTEVTSAKEALKSILAGSATLAKKQTEAPLGLLSLVFDAIGCLDTLGPSASNASTEINYLEKLTRYGARQDYVDGHEIPWRDGSGELKKLASNCWSNGDDELPCVMEQLRAVLNAHLDTVRVWNLLKAPSAEEMRRDCLVHERHFGIIFLDGTYGMQQLTPPWFEFHHRLENADLRIQEVVNQGLSDSRILAFEERGAAAVRLAPRRSFDIHLGEKCWYLLTRDLPKAWFQPSIDLKSSREKAETWLSKAGELAVMDGKRIARDDAIEVMSKKFELSTHAATRVWDGRKNPSKGGQGRIPKGKKVLFDDLVNLRFDFNILK
jgi:hypothetical protein